MRIFILLPLVTLPFLALGNEPTNTVPLYRLANAQVLKINDSPTEPTQAIQLRQHESIRLEVLLHFQRTQFPFEPLSPQWSDASLIMHDQVWIPVLSGHIRSVPKMDYVVQHRASSEEYSETLGSTAELLGSQNSPFQNFSVNLSTLLDGRFQVLNTADQLSWFQSPQGKFKEPLLLLTVVGSVPTAELEAEDLKDFDLHLALYLKLPPPKDSRPSRYHRVIQFRNDQNQPISNPIHFSFAKETLPENLDLRARIQAWNLLRHE